MEGDALSFIPTRGSAVRKSENFQAVIFESYKSKNASKNEKQVKNSQDVNSKDIEFNVKQAKHEIIKFGTSGFDPQKREEAKVQLAIKLGAKPPKNRYINYKLLQAEKKKGKEKEASRLNFQQLGKNSIGKSKAKGKSFDRKRRNKEKGDILSIYGRVKLAKSI